MNEKVIGCSRPSPAAWVQEMAAKHQSLRHETAAKWASHPWESLTPWNCFYQYQFKNTETSFENVEDNTMSK